MALKKSEIYSTLTKCANKLRSNSGIGAEQFKNYVLILLFLKYVSDKLKSGERSTLVIPAGCTFDDVVALKGKRNIGERINEIIAAISEKNELEDVIRRTDHDFCDDKLGNVEESSKLISELVSAFQSDGLDFSKNRAADDDLIGDAYEYLMRNFASQSGKDKGQFYTPTEISRLMALLIGIDQDERTQISAYDPTCGSGSLLLRVRAAATGNVSLDGQDIDPANIELSYLNMVIHGYDRADIRRGDTLNNPQHVHNGSLMTYDYVVSNPKFSLHNWMSTAKENDIYGRWNQKIGVPPQQYGDFAFLLHCVKSLNSKGACAIILPNGVLTRGGDEERLRRWLIEDQRIMKGIIAFPANTFFGTTIAANVLILDKKRSQDGVFFIDASGCGYKDEDSKIRLLEKDIKRIIDVWRKREDVPHFARLVTYDVEQREGEPKAMHEIERNNYSLNLSLYVTPEDKDVHHDIEAHLHGGIPEADIDRMQSYWDICPTLRQTLFDVLRPGYYKLRVAKDKVAETIGSETSVAVQHGRFSDRLDEWCGECGCEMKKIAKGNKPKEVIAEWGQSILDAFADCQSLVNAYDVYDQLLGYYNNSMQDDLYMISNGGWLPELVIPSTKKSYKWFELHSDLLPVDIVVSHFHADIKEQLDQKTAELEEVQQQMANLVEENEEHFDESLFFGKLTAANFKKKLAQCMARRLTDTEKAVLQSVLPMFADNKKTSKVARESKLKQYMYLFEDGAKLTKSTVANLLKASDEWEYSTSEQLELWTEYLCLMEQEKVLKDEIKNQEAALKAAILATYKEMDEKTARNLIVEDKWLVAIKESVSQEMQTAIHCLVSNTHTLAERYEFTLQQLTDAYEKKTASVMSHLKKMGFEV